MTGDAGAGDPFRPMRDAYGKALESWAKAMEDAVSSEEFAQASGRIDAMMKNAKDPAVRKPLEDRVAKDWAEVKAADDEGRVMRRPAAAEHQSAAKGQSLHCGPHEGQRKRRIRLVQVNDRQQRAAAHGLQHDGQFDAARGIAEMAGG